MQTSIGTYMSLSDKVRKTLGDNFYISSSDCSKQYMFEGELTGYINVPFADVWAMVNEAVRTNDPALIKILSNNIRANTESALSIVSMVQPVSFDDNQVRKLKAITAPGQAMTDAELEIPFMLEVFTAFGGKVNPAEKDKKVFRFCE